MNWVPNAESTHSVSLNGRHDSILISKSAGASGSNNIQNGKILLSSFYHDFKLRSSCPH